MDKEAVVHIHNGILLSFKKEHIWVNSNEADETGAYFTEWSKSEREIAIEYIHTYIWNLKTVMMILHTKQQKRHRCKEQTFGPCGKREDGVILREQHWNMYIAICKIDDQCRFNAWSRALKAGALWQPRGRGGEGGGKCFRMRRHMYGKNHHNIVLKKLPYSAIKIN